MISPEILRKYQFFAAFDSEQLKSLAMIAEVIKYQSGVTIYSDQEIANKIFLLLNGSGDVFFRIGDVASGNQKLVSVGEINPGELFGFSALFEPYKHISTVKTAKDCETLVVPTEKLNNILKSDHSMTNIFYRQVAISVLERLNSTRIQLAAAWA